jgi:hypothetical protein
LIAAGLPFCSLQATTQHLQPMQLPMSTWKRYCSPSRGGRAGILVSEAGAGKRARDMTNLASSSVVRRSSGKGIDTPAVQNAVQSPYETPRRMRLLVLERETARGAAKMRAATWSARRDSEDTRITHARQDVTTRHECVAIESIAHF